MCTAERTYPLQRPDGHQPPVPRWHLRFDDDGPDVRCSVAYVGVQLHRDAHDASSADRLSEALGQIRERVMSNASGCVYEDFETMDWNEADIRRVMVCYWNDTEQYKQFLSRFNLPAVHESLPKDVRSSVGLWLETFSVPVSRLETNYSGLDYLPGVARLPGTRTEEHTLTAYWGAARDRLDASAHDVFEGQKDDGLFKTRVVANDGPSHVIAENSNNIVHIRTGQYWQNCPEEEVRSYEDKLEPTLRSGLSYLRSTPTSGAANLRYLRNAGSSPTEPATEPLKETCVTGYFASLDALETWAKGHKSHLAIYGGAMKHAKVFGPARKFRTWHEVVILKEGEGRFEYVNCGKDGADWGEMDGVNGISA